MADRPRILDLFCGGGGAAVGYYRAGWEVVGVDHNDQPTYPFSFVRGDALEYCTRYGHLFDAIHASPPCQRWAPCTPRLSDHPDLLTPTVALLEDLRCPYIVENIPTSPLRRDALLCGTMFNLLVIRHRVFRSNSLLLAPQHKCRGRVDVARQGDIPRRPGQYMTVTGKGGHVLTWRAWVEAAGQGMGIDWMNGPSLVEAIPPAYTEFLGTALLRQARAEQE